MSIRKHARRVAHLSALLLASTAPGAIAQTATVLPPVTIANPVFRDPIDAPLTATTLSDSELSSARVMTSDSAALFGGVAGVSAYAAGGVSSVPAIHGLSADRVNLLVDGMTVGIACPNEMNSPLSYADPAQVDRATVMAGITPVSDGGDSIAGTIEVESPPPVFSKIDAVEMSGRASAFYRSNADSVGGSLTVTVAGENLSLAYNGTAVAAGDYAGGGHDGKVRSSEYEAANHALTLAWRAGTNLFVLAAGQQYIPREGYPNQPMDLLFNRSHFVNGRYEGAFRWGTFEARAYWQGVRHYMNFLADKGGTAAGGMPMDTKSENFGYAFKATVFLGAADTLKIGNAFVRFTLDDWWPPVPMNVMMGPNAYWNIDSGRRARLGTYAEWQRKWTGNWITLLGVRSDVVWADTGDVQPYSWTGMMNMADAAAAGAFNALPHGKTDSDFDLTALVRYAPDADATYEFGYARKMRAPTLYERYAWGRGAMSSRMVGWFGDGNGYVGNLALKPETAHTLSATADWTGGGTVPWEVRFSPYYTRIENYIGVNYLKTLSATSVQLQFDNHEAELYGADLNAALRLWDGSNMGTGTVRLTASWVKSRELTTRDNLYHEMPFNTRLTFEEKQGAWSGAAELVAVAGKTAVSTVQNEPKTGSYALLNLQGSYTWNALRFDAGIGNVFDTAYALPLGGVSLGDYQATGVLRPVPGMGRSVNIAITASL
ncbi:MAG: TonB-dependent receptor [Alphaproteobacteria bacterium]|nr:TonB-dependent receptor [Alphaproteobacteria bacterium]MDE2072799.1 TonB-dependent receptor [Alphaproteobacteria bacterium]MDE2351149.1 TonB-dependent receptor [Alphaproteobacteria bacterium]